MTFFELLQAIQQQFPHLIPILSQPGIFDILASAINDPVNWPPQRIEAAVQQTSYYQTTPQSQRMWDLFVARDPATAGQLLERAGQLVRDAQDQLGIRLEGGSGWALFSSPYWRMVQDAAMNNWSFQEIKYHLSQRGGFGTGGGEIETNAVTMRRLADDYGVPLADWVARIWGTNLARGTIDMRAAQGYLVEQAKSLYPGIASLLDRGFTVRQVADPYLQIAQRELGIDPTTVSLLDPKWNRAINSVSDQGQRTSMSLSDWTALIRQDPVYGYDQTIQARTQAARLSTALAQMMGAI